MPPQKSEQLRWFEESISPHEAMLRNWLARRFPGIRDRDDLIQDSYVRVLQARERGTVCNPKAFLFTTARNLALDQVRRGRVLPFFPLPPEEESIAEDGHADPMEQASQSQELDILSEAIASLPSRCREIFLLRKVHGCSQRDIAARLGLSENTVSAQLTIGFNKCSLFVRSRTGKESRS